MRQVDQDVSGTMEDPVALAEVCGPPSADDFASRHHPKAPRLVEQVHLGLATAPRPLAVPLAIGR
ncbi:MAG: hypothetical protein ACR2KJ_06880 [Jatrophihabitans sp.]